MPDIMPSQIVNVNDVERLEWPSFKEVIKTAEIIGFVLYLSMSQICYKLLKRCPRFLEHFKYTAGKVKRSPGKEYAWYETANRLAMPLKKEAVNMDSRTSFVFNKHYFLCKSQFTFGQRRVKKNTAHILQVGPMHLLLFTFNEKYMDRLKFKKGRLPSSQFKYMKKKLRRNKSYLIPENTIYVLYTVSKTFFSLHVVKANEVQNIPFAIKGIFKSDVNVNNLESEIVDELNSSIPTSVPVIANEPPIIQDRSASNHDNHSELFDLNEMDLNDELDFNILTNLDTGDQIISAPLFPFSPHMSLNTP